MKTTKHSTDLRLSVNQLGLDVTQIKNLLTDVSWHDAPGLSTGQPRATNAFELFSKPQCNGQNLFLSSYPTIDTKGLIKELLTSNPHGVSDVFDTVYVEDLANPRRPICLQLPRGQATKFTRLVNSWLKHEIKEPPLKDHYVATLDSLLKSFKRLPKVINYLTDLAKRLDRGSKLSHPVLVNNFVSHQDSQPFPIVHCDNPSVTKLFGDIAMLTDQGSTVANHHLLQPGLLHYANGGVMILPAERLLDDPNLWFELKSSLLDQEIKWTCANSWLDPKPIELKLQIVLVGDPMSYKDFIELDPDFIQLFPLVAEINHQVDLITDQDVITYAGYLQNLARRHDYADLSVGAIARLMNLSSNLVEHQKKLSLDSVTFSHLIAQAQSYCVDAETIGEQDIIKAINDAQFRKNRIAHYSFEAIEQKQLIITTLGKKIGQINGLSVLETDLDSFGEPSRITAAVYYGNGEVDDVERKVDLAGNIHAKGVAILTSYLHQKFALEDEIPLSANLVFEQSYQGIDGDSAAMASLICLLSAFSKQPLNQGVAITGALDQFGNVLAVGGINEKIEGYFKTCQLNPNPAFQGVIMPASNQLNLNLSPDVIAAVAKGDFVIYAIDHIDQAIEICFELSAGTADDDGHYGDDTLYGMIAQRIELIHNPQLHSESLFERLIARFK
ncbi:MAG: AAA family ATPase [Gammaproteobacteria bacterium]|nr:AAA family ATPase [Gammaproteobacteria bacterium]